MKKNQQVNGPGLYKRILLVQEDSTCTRAAKCVTGVQFNYLLPGTPWTQNHHLVKFFPCFVGGRMVSHPHREPKVLSFLLPLSRHASLPLLLTWKHLCFPSVTLPHHPNPQLQAIPNQPPYLHTPHWPFRRDWQENLAHVSFYCLDARQVWSNATKCSQEKMTFADDWGSRRIHIASPRYFLKWIIQTRTQMNILW